MQRILIVRFSSIGDIVLTSPVVRALRKKFPSADIRFLTKGAFVELVEHNPYLNCVFRFEGNLKETIAQIKDFRPDVIVDLHHNLRTAIIKASVGAKAYAFPKLNVEKWLHVNLKLDVLPDIHIVERYFKAVARLGVTNDGEGLDVFIPEEVTMPHLPESLKEGYVAIVVGAKFATKRIPEQKLKEIIEGSKTPVVLIGGAEDQELGDRLASGPEVFNACGKFTMLESARLIQNAQVVVSPDTGMMHIAAAFNRPIVSVWGSTVPEFGMYPYMPQHPEDSTILEQKGLSCRPCSKIGFDRCPKGHFDCMTHLDSQQLLTIVNQKLAR